MACVFCAIVAGDAAASEVRRDEHHVAFLDTRPLFKGHVLVVPAAHVVTLPDLPSERRDGFFALVQRLSAAVGLGAQGLVDCTFLGAPSGQILGFDMAAA